MAIRALLFTQSAVAARHPCNSLPQHLLPGCSQRGRCCCCYPLRWNTLESDAQQAGSGSAQPSHQVHIRALTCCLGAAPSPSSVPSCCDGLGGQNQHRGYWCSADTARAWAWLSQGCWALQGTLPQLGASSGGGPFTPCCTRWTVPTSLVSSGDAAPGDVGNQLPQHRKRCCHRPCLPSARAGGVTCQSG